MNDYIFKRLRDIEARLQSRHMDGTLKAELIEMVEILLSAFGAIVRTGREMTDKQDDLNLQLVATRQRLIESENRGFEKVKQIESSIESLQHNVKRLFIDVNYRKTVGINTKGEFVNAGPSLENYEQAYQSWVDHFNAGIKSEANSDAPLKTREYLRAKDEMLYSQEKVSLFCTGPSIPLRDIKSLIMRACPCTIKDPEKSRYIIEIIYEDNISWQSMHHKFDETAAEFNRICELLHVVNASNTITWSCQKN